MRWRSWSLNSSSSSWSPVGDQCDHPIEAVVVVLVVVVVDVVVPLVISVTQELIIRYWSFPEMTIIHWTCGQLEEFNWTALDQHNTTGSLGTWSMSSSYLANSNSHWWLKVCLSIHIELFLWLPKYVRSKQNLQKQCLLRTRAEFAVVTFPLSVRRSVQNEV